MYEIALSGIRYCRYTDGIAGTWYKRTGLTYINAELALKIASKMQDANDDDELFIVVLDSTGREIHGAHVPTFTSDTEMPF